MSKRLKLLFCYLGLNQQCHGNKKERYLREGTMSRVMSRERRLVDLSNNRHYNLSLYESLMV